jgi:hypothetical protein
VPDDPRISALVMLRPGSGRELTGATAITAANLAEYLPDPGDLALVRDAFARAGFGVGDPVGIAFSVEAPRSRFERFFATTVGPAEQGGFGAFEGGRGQRELPLSALPPPVRERVVAVTFEPPAELFGPGSVEPWR